MLYTTHQGVHIHYQVEGEGPPLVLLHGFNSSLASWSSGGTLSRCSATTGSS